MREIMDEYGDLILSIISSLLFLLILAFLVFKADIVGEYIIRYISQLCIS